MFFIACLIIVAFWIKFGWFWGLLALIGLVLDLIITLVSEIY